MALTPGTRLGPYEVVSAIGAGGMGEVYRATDTKLKRQVAIKILPPSVAADHDRLARFQREAEVLASLNHPHIAAIHGLEESSGVKALVMELIEGPTLADRIAHGALPVDETMPIARQIAEALEAAHERGIIHRDLKPANIKVRPDGTVKVLDFGLAKAMDPVGPMSTEVANSPTITSPALTAMGMILGTAAYMSPEQARGKAVDKRADVWAFGCVLYEMLTGQRAFDGEDVSLTLAEVMKSEPNWSALPPLPPLVDAFLRQCLKKDPRQRIGDIHDVRLALEGAFETTTVHAANAVSVVPPVWRQPVPVAGTTAVVAVLLAGLAAWSLWPTVEPRVVRRFPITLPSFQTLPANSGSLVVISPDGQTLAYRAVEANVTRFYQRSLGQLKAQPISGSEIVNAGDSLFSLDGNWLWFWSDTILMRAPLSGGRPVRVTERSDVGRTRGMTWGPDGALILGGRAAGLLRLPAGGDDLVTLATPDDGREYWYPQVLPDGRAVLFTASFNAADAGDVMILDLRTNTRRTLVRQAVAGWYAPTGHLVFLRGGDLWAIRFDPTSMEVAGDPVPIEQGIRVEGGGAVQFTVAADGSLVYLPSGSQAPRTLVWVDRQGRETPIPSEPHPYINPRLSPDGTRVALAASDRDYDLWVRVLSQSGLTRITSDLARDDGPIWTADGRRLIFFSTATGPWNIFWRLADGTGAAERLTESPNQQWPTAVSRDGLLVFTEVAKKTGNDVMQLTLDGTRRITPLVKSEFSERNGVIASDGHWLAYEANDSGQYEIYVRPFPDVNTGRWKVSSAGGTAPVWAPSGQELFYVAPTGALMSVAMSRGPSATTIATQVVKAGYYTQTPTRAYDLASDGQRFLMLKEADTDPAEPDIVIVQNWFEELKRLVPTK